MKLMAGRCGALIGLAGVLALAAGNQAGASGAVPAPCDGSGVLADAKGDATYTKAYAASVGPTITPAPASYDVRQVFLTYGPGADGKKQLKANLVIEDLSGEQISEPWSSEIRYSVEIDIAGEFIRPTAISKDGEFSYMYYSDRVAPPAGNPRYLTETDTTGSTVSGPGGVVTIDIPADLTASLKPGDKVQANGYTWAHTGTNVGGSLVDYAPDDRSFKSFTITECTPGAAATPATAAEPTPSSQPQQQPQQGQQQPSSQPQSGATPAPAAKKKPSCAAKAKKRFKGKKNKKKLKAALKKCRKAKKK